MGLDYSFLDSLKVQFSSSDTEKEVRLVIEDDSQLEESETFFITLNLGPGANYDDNSFANVVITDDDRVMLQFDMETCALVFSEAAGSVEITVARIGLSSIPVNVSVQIQNGTAIGIYTFYIMYIGCGCLLILEGRDGSKVDWEGGALWKLCA